VAVLDFVLPIGSIASIVGYDGQANLVTLAELPPEKTDTAFFSEGLPNLPAWRFHLLAGSLDPESASNLRIDRLAQIVGALKAAYDYVFIDIGRSLSKVVLPIIQQADLVALIISADLGAVKLTRLVWQYLQSKGLSPDHIYPILNRVVGFEGVTKPEVEQQLGLPIRTTIPHLSGNLSLANNQHIPLALKFPGDSSTVILKETALQMMDLADRMRAGTRRERGG
jgi:MinD-like ATPase involved in chromosome partitioning or flagellar assembly